MVKTTTRFFNVTSLQRHKDKRMSDSQYHYCQYENHVCTILFSSGAVFAVCSIGTSLSSEDRYFQGDFYFRELIETTKLDGTFLAGITDGGCYFRNSFFRK